MEVLGSFTSDYTTNQQQSKQYGTGTKKRYTDHWNRIKRPEINPCTYGQLMTEEARIYNGEKTDFSITGARKTRQLHVKE